MKKQIIVKIFLLFILSIVFISLGNSASSISLLIDFNKMHPEFILFSWSIFVFIDLIGIIKSKVDKR